MKLDELLNEHPELSNEKKQIEAVVSAFAGSKITIDKSFSQSLKSSIREKIKEKKAQNPNYFLFYLRHYLSIAFEHKNRLKNSLHKTSFRDCPLGVLC